MQIKMKRQKYENKKWIRVLRYKKVIIQEACKIYHHKGINNKWHQWLDICWEIRHFFVISVEENEMDTDHEERVTEERNYFVVKHVSFEIKSKFCGIGSYLNGL